MKCHRQGIIPWEVFFSLWVHCLLSLLKKPTVGIRSFREKGGIPL